LYPRDQLREIFIKLIGLVFNRFWDKVSTFLFNYKRFEIVNSQHKKTSVANSLLMQRKFYFQRKWNRSKFSFSSVRMRWRAPWRRHPDPELAAGTGRAAWVCVRGGAAQTQVGALSAAAAASVASEEQPACCVFSRRRRSVSASGSVDPVSAQVQQRTLAPLGAESWTLYTQSWSAPCASFRSKATTCRRWHIPLFLARQVICVFKSLLPARECRRNAFQETIQFGTQRRVRLADTAPPWRGLSTWHFLSGKGKCFDNVF